MYIWLSLWTGKQVNSVQFPDTQHFIPLPVYRDIKNQSHLQELKQLEHLKLHNEKTKSF